MTAAIKSVDSVTPPDRALDPRLTSAEHRHADVGGVEQHVTMQVGKPVISGPAPELSCVDEETEILTQRGWITHRSLHRGEAILSLDPRSRETRWEAG